MTGLMPPAVFLAIPHAQTCQAAKRRPIRPPRHGSAARALSLSAYSLYRRARRFPIRISDQPAARRPPVEMMLFYRVRLMRRTDGPSPEACKYAAAAPAVT